MKNCILIVFAVTLVVALCAARPEKYTSRFDNVDVDQILKTDRLFENYFKCVMAKGNCTPEGKELKGLLPDALQNGCAKCTEKQRAGSDKVLRFLVERKPKHWKELKEKYDPEDKYIKRYSAEAAARGIQL